MRPTTRRPRLRTARCWSRTRARVGARVHAGAAVHRRPGGRRHDRGDDAQGGGGGLQGGRHRRLLGAGHVLRVHRGADREAAAGARRRGS
eukprot:2149160-Prymnesium_polylepis.2